MWRSRIAVICDCRYFCAHRGGHGSPLFVIAVVVVAGVDAVDVVVVVPSCAVFPFCWTGCHTISVTQSRPDFLYTVY